MSSQTFLEKSELNISTRCFVLSGSATENIHCIKAKVDFDGVRWELISELVDIYVWAALCTCWAIVYYAVMSCIHSQKMIHWAVSMAYCPQMNNALKTNLGIDFSEHWNAKISPKRYSLTWCSDVVDGPTCPIAVKFVKIY